MEELDNLLAFISDPVERKRVQDNFMSAMNRGLVAQTLGAPADMLNLGANAIRAGVGYAGNKLGLLSADQMPALVDKPTLGSEWIGDKMQQYGAVNGNRNPVAETLAGGLLGPLIGAEAASGRPAAAISRVQENAAAPTTLGNQRGIFGGQWARTANNDAREKAIQLLDAGVDNRDVYKRTFDEFGQGWFKGPDGQLRFEIPDNSAKFVLGSGPSMGEKLKHPSMYEAYPPVENMNVDAERVFSPNPQGAWFSENPGSGQSPFGLRYGGPEDARSSLAHELQHYVQMREGFARGGSPGAGSDAPFVYGGKAVDAIEEQQSALIKQMESTAYATPEYDKLSRVYDTLNQQKERAAAMEGYRRLAGESEARAVQARMHMTPEQRMAVFPLDSYDVPLDQLIFRK